MLPVFVTRSDLQERRADVVLVDVRRAVPGLAAQDAYDRGHLPGAVLVDLDRWLAGPATAEHGRHPLPAPEVFAQGLSLAGVGDDDAVVAYDDADGVVAARLVWMLRALGQDAALLDGGLRPGEAGLSAEPVHRDPAQRRPRPWPAEALADLEDALDPGNVVLDARSSERFGGAPDPLDPRPGHVPGARSLPCFGSLDAQGRLLPVDALRQRFLDVGAGPGAPVVAYCGSGVTACHDLLVREHVGLGRGRLYPGSWSQYAGDPDRPVEL